MSEKKNYSAVFTIVLYNKNPYDSITICNLLNFSNSIEKRIKILIWNNGPKKINKKDIPITKNINIDIEIVETISNISLAIIYNKSIENNNSNLFIFLDDDSVITKNYFFSIFQVDRYKIAIPLITVNGKINYPLYGRRLIKKPFTHEALITSKTPIITIGSGLVIGNEVIHIILKKYNKVFDERYLLYGVDISFCLRLRQLEKINIKIIPGFEHSLSRLKKEKNSIKDFRKKEISYSVGLTLRYYKPLLYSIIKISAYFIIFNINFIFKRNNNFYLFLMLKTYIKGYCKR